MLQQPNVNKTYRRQCQKMNNNRCPRKRCMSSFRAFNMADVSKQERRQSNFKFFISNILFIGINSFESSNWLYVTFFRDTQQTAHTVSNSKHCYVTHYLLERRCSLFRPLFKKFAYFRRLKQTNTLQDLWKMALFDNLL